MHDDQLLNLMISGLSRKRAHTSVKGTRGGPNAMSAAVVPGRILRIAFASKGFRPNCPCSLGMAMGDLGPSWSSAMGGGLGSRGELEGEAAMVQVGVCVTW
jgi:hypothetical protein